MSDGGGDESLPVPDDAGEVLAKCRAFFLKKLGCLLQEVEPLPGDALQAFVTAVGTHYDEMVAAERTSRFSGLHGLTASRFALVTENDLEADIRLNAFAARLLEANSAELWLVYLRFVTLLGRPDLSPNENPVAPRAIAKGLISLSAALGDNHTQTLQRIARLEDCLRESLPGLYVGLNEFLVSCEVSAAQPTIVTAPDVIALARSGAADSLVALGPAVILRQRLLGKPAAGVVASTGGATAALLNQAVFSRLLARLDQFDVAGNPPVDGQVAVPRLLNATELGLPPGASEAAVIDTLSLIFAEIFESPTLPNAVKSALADLQVPILRAAMLDSSLFTADAHPARQLLDKTARVAVGLPLYASSEHPLCASIQKVVARVRGEFISDMKVLSERVAELDRLIAERDAATAQAASAYDPLLKSLEQSDLMGSLCRQWIDRFCTNFAVPPRIADFLRAHWQRVLCQIGIECGEDGPEWQEHTAVLDKLLWSIQPKVEIDEQKRLMRELPQIMQVLSSGMQRVSVPEAIRDEFLDTCFALQTAAMRGRELPPSVPARPVPGMVAVSSELWAGDHVLRIFDLAGGWGPPGHSRRSPVRTGDWLAFRLGEDQALCGRVCHIGTATGKLLLANPDWDFAVALNPAIVENQIKDGRASISSRISLFNAAAEQALRKAPVLR